MCSSRWKSEKNLETHRVIDVLPDREAATLATWLRQHPEVEVVSRDRAGAYAEGIRQGAPQAVQVADRWHLLKNIGDALERALSRRHRVLRMAAAAVLQDEQACRAAVPAASDPPATAFPVAPLERSPAAGTAAQERRQERYETVQRLCGQGLTIAEVARQLHLTRSTVRKQVRAAACPERTPHPHLLTPFEPYLRYRWAQGCRNARALYDELRTRGYRGSYTHLRHALCAWRDQPTRHGRAAWVPLPPPPPMPCLRPVSPRQARWLLLRPAEDLDDLDRAFLMHLRALAPEVPAIQDLACRFCVLIRDRDAAGLEPWLCAAEASNCAEVRGFAEGLRRDRSAVDAALTVPWSQGVTEGKVNKLKVLKRVAYGRSAFDLLRIRVLHAA